MAVKNRVNRFLTVTAEKRTCYAGRWVEIGQEVTVPAWLASCFLKEGKAPKSVECYPCKGDLYTDTVALKANEATTIQVPDIEGCGRPANVDFKSCVACFFAEFNGPVAMPDANLEGGISPVMNPTCQKLCETGKEAVTEISIVSPTDGFVQLIYTGQCDC